jgi:hypothetical protein
MTRCGHVEIAPINGCEANYQTGETGTGTKAEPTAAGSGTGGCKAVRGLVPLAMAVSMLAACGAAVGEIEPSRPTPATQDIPVLGFGLNRSMPQNQGLLLGVDPKTGYPATEGPTMDPLIAEARRFYDVNKYPRVEEQLVDYPDPFTGGPPGMRRTAPLTFESWKVAFNFPARQPGQSLQSYRDLAGVVTYYNRNELGLGRELACASFVDGTDPNGQPVLGLACYVTNYGSMFRDEVRSLAEAVEGSRPRNTVCITWRPTMEPGYEVQFYVYGSDGRRMDWAQLDNFGPRPHPQVCTACHGGAYDENKHLVRNGRFLPLDPNVVSFASNAGVPPGLTRGGQEERIRAINAASLRTPLTPAQEELIHELYGGSVMVPGARSRSSWIPVGWRGNPQQEDLFDQVIKPYCATCHMALQQGLDGSALLSYGVFRSAADLRRFPLQAVICDSFGMPNAQATSNNFWDPQLGPVSIGGRTFAAPADGLLDWLGLTRSSCNGLQEVGTCNRGPDPDALCGNAASGTACNRQTGRCEPQRTGAAGEPRGYCRLDGSRTCPQPLRCVSAAAVTEGMASFDGVCVGGDGP